MRGRRGPGRFGQQAAVPLSSPRCCEPEPLVLGPQSSWRRALLERARQVSTSCVRLNSGSVCVCVCVCVCECACVYVCVCWPRFQLGMLDQSEHCYGKTHCKTHNLSMALLVNLMDQKSLGVFLFQWCGTHCFLCQNARRMTNRDKQCSYHCEAQAPVSKFPTCTRPFFQTFNPHASYCGVSAQRSVATKRTRNT